MKPLTNLRPLSRDELFLLSAGSKFIVYWAKDDNPNDVRFDFEARTVATNDGKVVVTDEDEWYFSRCFDDNGYDTSRGTAYFYSPGAT